MAERLGVVLYWLGCGLAIIFLSLAAFAISNNTEKIVPILLGFVPAAICYLVGRACRFVLSGY